MVQQQTRNRYGDIEAIATFATIAGAIATALSLTFIPSPTLAVAGTTTVLGGAYGYTAVRKRETTQRLQQDLTEATARLQAVEQEAVTQRIAGQQAVTLMDRLEAECRGVKQVADQRIAALDTSLMRSRENTAQLTAQLEQSTAELCALRDADARHSALAVQWGATLDSQNADITRLESEVARLTVELATHSEHKALLVDRETYQLKDRLAEALATVERLTATTSEMGGDVASYRQALGSVQATLAYLSGDGYSEVQTAHTEAVQSLLSQVQQLTAQLQEAVKPKLFGMPGEYARADKLIDLLWANGHTVDANEVTPAADGCFAVALNVRDRTKLCAAYVDELSKLGDYLATQVNALEPLRFELDRVNPFRVTTSICYASKPKAVANVDKLWRTAEQFVSTVSKWQRIRITGGSESGKSPLAELIVAAIQQSKAVDVRLAFPIANSIKNHWTLGVTHSTVASLAAELKAVADARASGKDKSKTLVLGVMDEVDTALSDDAKLAPLLKELVKTGSHTAVGCVLVGQSANVSNYRGLQRTDLENMISVHIGANAYHAISNSAMSEDEQRKLKDKADKLTRYCEQQNADLDVDADSDKLMRFALVLEPGRAGYYIQLPRFGSIAPMHKPTAPATAKPNAENVCLHCGGTAFTRNGKTPDGKQRLKCKNTLCGKSLVVDATEATANV